MPSKRTSSETRTCGTTCTTASFIWEQDKDDDDGLEYYVRHCIEDGDLTWFPKNKAIRLSEHLEKGAVGSLPYEFRENMKSMEEQMDRRMVQLKDQVVRSIGRVEQALVFVPETAVKKPKKTTTAPSGDYDSMSVGESISFRPGTTAQAFMEGEEAFGEGGSIVSRPIRPLRWSVRPSLADRAPRHFPEPRLYGLSAVQDCNLYS